MRLIVSHIRHGISLGGVDVMRKLAQLVDDVLERGIRGSFVEAGAWKGANGILVRKLFDAASDVADQMRKVYSLDTFAWFPNKTNPVTGATEREAFTQRRNNHARVKCTKHVGGIPRGTLSSLYYTSLGLLCLVLLYALTKRANK